MRYFLSIVTLALAGVMTHAQFVGQTDVPKFHATSPAKGQALPPVLTQAQLTENGATQPAQKESYKAAAKVPGVMYQLPCYCYCDRNHGHSSLHSCFQDMHGANCGTCMAEALYAYQQSKKGWTPKMIRDGIIRGEFKQIDLQHPTPVS